MASFPYTSDLNLADLQAPRLDLSDAVTPESMLTRLRSQNRALEHLRQALDIENESAWAAPHRPVAGQLERSC